MTTLWPIGRASPGRLPRRLRDAADTAIADGAAIGGSRGRSRAGGHETGRPGPL